VLARRIGLRSGACAQALRVTACTLMLESGASEGTVRELLGLRSSV